MASVSNNYYEGVDAVSPMYEGEEKKDQDRAVWFPVSQTACVCDGVTSSPCAEEAAELVTKFSPALFSGDVEQSMKVISDLLVVLRTEKLHSEVNLVANMPVKMREILQETAREKARYSYQTTLVAAKFVLEDTMVVSSMVWCGDSVFLAFDSKGQLLASSPAGSERSKCAVMKTNNDLSSAKHSGNITFGPGE